MPLRCSKEGDKLSTIHVPGTPLSSTNVATKNNFHLYVHKVKILDKMFIVWFFESKNYVCGMSAENLESAFQNVDLEELLTLFF